MAVLRPAVRNGRCRIVGDGTRIRSLVRSLTVKTCGKRADRADTRFRNQADDQRRVDATGKQHAHGNVAPQPQRVASRSNSRNVAAASSKLPSNSDADRDSDQYAADLGLPLLPRQVVPRSQLLRAVEHAVHMRYVLECEKVIDGRGIHQRLPFEQCRSAFNSEANATSGSLWQK